MTNSPAKEIQDPMVGKAGTDAGAPKQQTGTEQRPNASGSEGKSGAETPGKKDQISDAAIKAGDDAAEKLDNKDEKSRKEEETK